MQTEYDEYVGDVDVDATRLFCHMQLESAVTYCSLFHYVGAASCLHPHYMMHTRDASGCAISDMSVGDVGHDLAAEPLLSVLLYERLYVCVLYQI